MLGLFVLIGMSAAGVAGAKAARVYHFEARMFHPPPQRTEAPPDAHALHLREVTLKAAGELSVRGWFIPSRNGAAVIYLHGSPATRAELLPEARALAQSGYGALLIDVPGHGESTGDATWGRSATEALRACTDFLAGQPGMRAIGAYGFSMGAGVVARDAVQDSRIGAVAMAGVFTTVEEQLAHEFRSWHAVSRVPALWAAKNGGLAVDELRPIDVIAQLAPRPILIIAGSEDPIIPTQMPLTLYAAAGEPKQLLMVQGAGHGGYAGTMGSAYFERLREFFDAALLGHEHVPGQQHVASRLPAGSATTARAPSTP